MLPIFTGCLCLSLFVYWSIATRIVTNYLVKPEMPCIRPSGDPAENRTPVSSLRGSRPSRQTTGPYFDNSSLSTTSQAFLQSEFKYVEVLLYPCGLGSFKLRITLILRLPHSSRLQPEFNILQVLVYPLVKGNLMRQVEKKDGLFQLYPSDYLRTLLPSASWFTLAQDSGHGPSSVCLSLGGKSCLPRIAGDIRDYHSNGAAFNCFLLRCVYRATHGAHNSTFTMLQLPKPPRFKALVCLKRCCPISDKDMKGSIGQSFW